MHGPSPGKEDTGNRLHHARHRPWLGLWAPKTDARLPLTHRDAVRNDGRDRILIAQVPEAR
ncbi:hypothetical protein [Myxococcus xanthus]|uniref:hypothetical protein n=1 Tax=Myxococcus xanthus TaxID=34 RepID=UPI00112B81C5|nr:hypothetical protein [Myxococcus xanthus]QDF06704.1 hypothetical protein BHS04_26445 [Myxococcus xanthus]